MLYSSTRGAAPVVGFDQILTSGLAPDGGLYVPESWPVLDLDELAKCKTYPEVAAQVMRPFIEGSVCLPVLDDLADHAYKGFRRSEVAPISPLGEDWLLELYWGPTLSFKDYALQLVGRMLDHVLEQRGRTATVLVATSGDTGSSAMEACRDRKALQAVVLFPAGRISEFQRRQMTTIESANVRAVAVEGTFDDCQALVKAAFAAWGAAAGLVALNSINWARVAAQTAYYTSALLRLGALERGAAFAIPTGNFGNALAGYVAHKMGLPMRRLIIANNSNHGLFDLIVSGGLSIGSVTATLAPAMDIQVPSNLERLAFDLTRSATASLMTRFRETGQLELAVDDLFRAGYRTDSEVIAAIARAAGDHGVVVDPHTAIGWSVGVEHRLPEVPLVIVATAHPAKFPEAVEQALGTRPAPPADLADIWERAESLVTIPNELAALRTILFGESS